MDPWHEQDRFWETTGAAMFSEARLAAAAADVEAAIALLDIEPGARTDLDLSHRIYSAAELKGLLAGCGFAETSACGNLEGAPYDQTARRLVVVARK